MIIITSNKLQIHINLNKTIKITINYKSLVYFSNQSEMDLKCSQIKIIYLVLNINLRSNRMET